jgi:hypothetical protein
MKQHHEEGNLAIDEEDQSPLDLIKGRGQCRWEGLGGGVDGSMTRRRRPHPDPAEGGGGARPRGR